MSDSHGHRDWADVDLLELARHGPVHFMGIAGAGMSVLAELLLRAGGNVTGCDLRPGAVGAHLTELGAHIVTGHDPTHARDAVALVMTSAVRPDHAEVAAAQARGIPALKRAQALGAIVNRGTVLAIAGTHGKTTTTAATTAILDVAGLDPTGLVGGRMHAWGGGLRAGGRGLFVVEADEYDRSFLTLRPSAAVITSVEADHLDIYGDVAAVEHAFVEFLGHVRPAGLVAVCSDDAGARRIAERLDSSAHVLRYGTGAEADLRAIGVQQHGRTMTFVMVEHAATIGTITLAAPGIHNVRNALGAFAAARHAGATFAAAQTALRTFNGVARRFQELGEAGGVLVIDDYAHHPTEITATLAAARGAYPGRRIVAAFQPHLYSRTRDLAADFGSALAAADMVWVTDVYAARELPIEGVTGELVVGAARAAGHDATHYTPTLDALHGELRGALRAGDVLVAMGAGDIDEMTSVLFAQLSAEVQA